jgi:hypothetical protein
MTDAVWREVTADEYVALTRANLPLFVGETLSDPDGDRFGIPHMLTTWIHSDGTPLLRHQCWPVGHTIGFSRPCLFETTLPATGPTP